MNAPRSASAPTTSTWSGSPKTTVETSSRALSERRTSSRCSNPASAPIRTRRIGRISDHHFRQPGRGGLAHRVQQRVRHDSPSDGRALLTGFDRHLGGQRFDEQVELRCAGHRVRAQDGAVQRIGLGGEPHAVGHHRGMGAQLAGGARRTGEADQILLGEVVQEVAGAAGDQLDRAVRQQPRLDDQFDESVGDVGRRAGRLDQTGNAGQERRREFLHRPPDREVERVDLYRHPAQRGPDVLPQKGSALAQRLECPVGQHGVAGQLAATLAGIAEQDTEAAVHVEHRVTLGSAGAGRQRVEVVAVLAQVGGQGLEQGGPLVESQRPQGGTADAPSVVERARPCRCRRWTAGRSPRRSPRRGPRPRHRQG